MLINKNYPKIVAPAKNLLDIKLGIKSNADEFYCGVIDRFNSNILSTNRRDLVVCNYTNFIDLKKSIDLSHQYNKKVFLTVNSNIFTKKTMNIALNQISKSIKIGIDGLILGNLALIIKVNKEYNSIDMHLSSTLPVFNNSCAGFFKGLGIKRIIFPRDIGLNEITNITSKNPDLEFEYMVLNYGCPFIEGYCNFLHGLSEAKHKNIFNIKTIKKLEKLLNMMPEKASSQLLDLYRKKIITCSYNFNCSSGKSYNFIHYNDYIGYSKIYMLDKLFKAGITHFKIVGRDLLHKKKVNDIKLVNKSFKNIIYKKE